MNLKHVNWPILAVTLAGASFLVPSSAEGINISTGQPLWRTYCGAGAMVALGLIGAAKARASQLACLIAIGSWTLSVGTDCASIWEQMRRKNNAPITMASSQVTAAERQLTALIEREDAIRQQLREKLAETDAEAPASGDQARVLTIAGLYPKWKSLRTQADRIRAELDEILVEKTRLAGGLAAAQVQAATAEADAMWLAKTSWGPWAIMGFAALFEALLIGIGTFLIKQPAQAQTKPAPMLVPGRGRLKGLTTADHRLRQAAQRLRRNYN